MRQPYDSYPTESAVTKVLLDRVALSIDEDVNVTEPCAGDGAITTILQKRNCINVFSNDINSAWDGHNSYKDATKPDVWKEWQQENPIDWVITNPPFGSANLILPLAYKAATVGVAFLLRLTYLEPARNRGKWLRSHSSKLTNLIILGQPRPSFTGNGRTDCSTVAWMVWRKEARTDTIVDFVFDWKQ